MLMDNSNTRSVDKPKPSGKNKHMKVLAINASPHKDKGNTTMILAPFLEEMQEAGAEV